MPTWPEQVISFWFDELSPEDWFKQSDAVDDAIRERFGELYSQLKDSPPDLNNSDPDTALAAIIVLDQFPRNMFRGQAAAFGSDQIAASLARAAIDAGFDAKLEQNKIPFVYMPLMHSESLADQELSVEVFEAYGNENNLKYCIEHRDVVAKFGRFPHRNRALGRESTPQELEYLKTASGYGQ